MKERTRNPEALARHCWLRDECRQEEDRQDSNRRLIHPQQHGDERRHVRVPRRNDVRNEVQGRGHFLSALINKQSAEKVARESRETGERDKQQAAVLQGNDNRKQQQQQQ